MKYSKVDPEGEKVQLNYSGENDPKGMPTFKFLRTFYKVICYTVMLRRWLRLARC